MRDPNAQAPDSSAAAAAAEIAKLKREMEQSEKKHQAEVMQAEAKADEIKR